MGEDSLDKPLGLTLSWSKSGISLSTNSRFANAVDRWAGAKIYKNAVEDDTALAIAKAKADAEIGFIKASAEAGLLDILKNPELAQRAIASHTRRIVTAQNNKEAVLLEAKKDLEENPPLEDKEGNISEETLDMFEEHSEKATSQKLREMFGKLLAEEIRIPGTVSEGTMHFVKLLDRETASLIETVAPYCVGKSCIVDAMPEPLPYSDDLILQQAGFWSAQSTLSLRPSGDDQFDEGFINGNNNILRVGLGGKEIDLSVRLLSKAAEPLVSSLSYKNKWDEISGACLKKGATKVIIIDDLKRSQVTYGDFLYMIPDGNVNKFACVELNPETGTPLLDAIRMIDLR